MGPCLHCEADPMPCPIALPSFAAAAFGSVASTVADTRRHRATLRPRHQLGEMAKP